MTNQSPNDVCHAFSFLQGHNAEYVEQLHARYADDPNAVDESWQTFYRSLGDAPYDAKAKAAGLRIDQMKVLLSKRRSTLTQLLANPLMAQKGTNS